LMADSDTLGTLLKGVFLTKGIAVGSPEWDQFINAAKWILDDVDPINIAPYAKTRSITYVDPLTGETKQQQPKRLRMQMAKGDSVVPNSSTYRLRDATGVPSSEFHEFNVNAATGHGFLANPADIGFIPGQADLGDFLGGN
ncbi:MAG: hypothetical protein ACJ790_04555, partial [Myxococcaceae bacterium]